MFHFDNSLCHKQCKSRVHVCIPVWNLELRPAAVAPGPIATPSADTARSRKRKRVDYQAILSTLDQRATEREMLWWKQEQRWSRLWWWASGMTVGDTASMRRPSWGLCHQSGPQRPHEEYLVRVSVLPSRQQQLFFLRFLFFYMVCSWWIIHCCRRPNMQQSGQFEWME